MDSCSKIIGWPARLARVAVKSARLTLSPPSPATFHFHLHSLKDESLNSSGGPLVCVHCFVTAWGGGMMEDYYQFLSTGDYPMDFCTEKEV